MDTKMFDSQPKVSSEPPSSTTGPRRCVRTGLALATRLALLTMGPVVEAQTDNFNTGTDAGWTRYTPRLSNGAGATHTFPDGGSRIQSAASPNPGTLGPSRAGSSRLNQTPTDFVVTCDVVTWMVGPPSEKQIGAGPLEKPV